MTQNADTISQKYIVIDSCILEYLLNRDMNDSITQQLGYWCNNVFTLSVSEVSYAELVDGAHLDKETKVIDLLDKYHSFAISKRIITGAGKIGSVYKQEFPTEKTVSLGDKILAATSIIYGAPLVTANVKDFPHPFFKTLKDKNIIYMKDNKRRMINIALLFPNYEYLTYAFNTRK